MWNKTKKAVINDAIVIQEWSLKKRTKIGSTTCKNAIIERNELRKRALQNSLDECVEKYEEQSKLTNKTLKKEKRLHEKKKKQKKRK